MKKFNFLFIFLLLFFLTSLSFGGRILFLENKTYRWPGGPTSGADYFIPLNETIVPAKNADGDSDGSGDLGTGTFTNADATNRTYFDFRNSGYLTAAAANTPRYQRITGDSYASLLVEPGGTNSCLQSRTFTHASWAKSANLDIAQDATGIDGTANSATTIGDQEAGSREELNQKEIAIPDDSNTHCVSIFVAKDNDETRFPDFSLRLNDGAADQKNYLMLNTKTGAINEYFSVGTAVNGVIDMADYGLEGWWRLWMTLANVSNGCETLDFLIYPAGGTVFGTTSNAATGTIIIDQAQVELDQAFPSNPIITTTTAVSRTTEAGFPNWSLPYEVNGSEEVTGGGFETGFTGGVSDDWITYGAGQTFTEETSEVHGGSSAQKCTSAVGANVLGIYQSINVRSGLSYKFSCWVYLSDAANVHVEYNNFTTNLHTTAVGAGVWTEVSFYDTTDTTGANNFVIYRGSGDTDVGDYIIIDDVSFKRADTVFAESLGAELCPDTTCATDWFDSIGAGCAHDPGDDEYDWDGSQPGTSFATEAAGLTLGAIYKISIEVKNYVAGNVRAQCGGGADGTIAAADGVYTNYLTCTTSTDFRLRASDTFNGSVTNISYKQVLNPSSEGGPPRGTVVAWVRPGFASTQGPPGGTGIISLNSGTAASYLYFATTAGRINNYDSVNSTNTTEAFSLGDWRKIVVQHGYLSSNVAKNRLGHDSGSGITWDATPGNYDGAYTLSGNIIEIGAAITGPFHIRAIEIYTDEIRTDAQIDAGGSP